MGVLKANDVIEPEQYYPYLAKFDPAYREVVKNAIGSCASIQDDIRRDVQNMGAACSAFGILFYVCVRQVTFSNCPADRWQSSHICDKIKQGVPMCG
uniref:Uncharacterized protein n=1 Tax=Anopheles dirus TaxID=7168 RepID=A0A182NMD7_9DIPT